MHYDMVSDKDCIKSKTKMLFQQNIGLMVYKLFILLVRNFDINVYNRNFFCK